MIGAASTYSTTKSGATTNGASTPNLCQRCRLPLRIDEHTELEDTAFDKFLSSPTSAALVEPKSLEDGQRDDTIESNGTLKAWTVNGEFDGKSKRLSNHGASGYLSRNSAGQAESFVIVPDSQGGNVRPPSSGQPKEQRGGYETMIENAATAKDDGGDSDSKDPYGADDEKYSLSNRFKTSDKLFDVISSKTSLDQPICSECMELLVDSLKQQYIEISRDRDAYAEFLKQVQNDKPTPEEQAEAERQLADIIRQQDEVMSELRTAEEERKKVEAEIEDLENQSKLLSAEEEQFWITRNKFSQELEDFLNERDAVKMQLAHDTELLEKLSKTNVYSDIFAIEGGHAAVDRMAGITGAR